MENESTLKWSKFYVYISQFLLFELGLSLWWVMSLWVLIFVALRGHWVSCSAQIGICGQIAKRKVTCENMCHCLFRPWVWDVWNFPGIVKEEKINKCPCSRGQRGESRCLTGQKCLVSSRLVRLLRLGFLARSLGFYPVRQLPGEIPPTKKELSLVPAFFLFRNADSGLTPGPCWKCFLFQRAVKEFGGDAWWSFPSRKLTNRLVLVAFRGWA